jgi:hypothetical protein
MVESVVKTANNAANYEIILRCHSDDQDTIRILPELMAMGPVYPYIGVPRSYTQNRRAFTEAIAIANADLMWVMNDDCMVTGNGWDDMVKDIPSMCIAKPQFHQLGPSCYEHDDSTPFVILPIRSWSNGWNQQFPGDTELWHTMLSRGWRTWWMKGIKVWHDRDEREIVSGALTPITPDP